METCNLEYANSFLTEYLLSLGFLPKHSGFNYIKQCIEQALVNDGILGSLSTQVYPCVAKRNGTNPVNIERNIRNSITCAKRSCEDCQDVDNVFFKVAHVSNRTFLAYLLDQVLISQMRMQQIL